MKPSKTTLSGAVAAVAVVVAAFTADATRMQLLAELVAAVAIAFLGRSAADCPANCPGTDAHRRPRPWQRDLFVALSLVVLCSAFLAIMTGCAVPNPRAGQGTPPAPAVIVDPRVNVWSNSVVPVATVAGEATGTGPALGTAAAGIFALVGAISAAIARRKSKEADALANGVIGAGAASVQAVLDSAATGPNRPAVSAAIVRARARKVAQAGSTPSTVTAWGLDAAK